MIKGTSILREVNEKRILRLLRESELTSRQDLARRSNLGKNTVSLIVDKLITDGIAKEVGIVNEKKAGRPKMSISLAPDALKVMGIDFEKNQIRFSVFNYHLNLVKTVELTNIDTDNLETVRKILKQHIKEITSQYPEIIGIGISVPGIVNYDDGSVKISNRLDWHEVELKKSIQEYFSNVVVINSVKALSLINSITDLSSVYYIRVRKGLGGAFIQKGEVMFGSSWIAGEVGQIPIYRRNGQEVRVEKLLNEDVVRDELASGSEAEVFKEKGEIIGWLISLIILLCNPAKVIVDAFYCQNKIFQDATLKSLSEKVDSTILKKTQIALDFTEDKTPEYGAAFAVIKEFEEAKI